MPQQSTESKLRGEKLGKGLSSPLTKMHWLDKNRDQWSLNEMGQVMMGPTLHREMIAAGLYSKRTALVDIRASVRQHVTLLLQLKNEGRWPPCESPSPEKSA